MAKRLNPIEFKEMLAQDQGILIDVRTALEVEAGYIEGAVNYDLNNGDFVNAMEHLDKSKTYYLYCRSGARSGKAAELLEQAGFPKVFNVGGFEELANAGFEVAY
ncbi:rhodanese-like domain-containing protein [Thermoflexibacter ruber]|uniref:Rhodanese-related sulfurtransferase n=1 Tax=Thermoflexibacter ruber TaxID=1003 RepID=A0A1I2H9J5_9BACT|nr:rhodanese-like domain-containing protein [Thermoflexibacter ruber]SFF26010.1 Rhodanese-related sulfurtransferase [Thermoflexibacter ruber]